MKKWMLGLIGAAAMSATASAQDAGVACVVADDGSGTICQTLFAGQTIDAGSVCVTVDGDSLTVTYETTGGWELVETHLWVGVDLADMPQTRKGNPKIGNFPYPSGDITGATTYTTTIPLADLGFSCPGEDKNYFVAAHAALRKLNDDGTYQTETGWGDGDRFVDRGAWGTFSSFTLHCCDDTEPPVEESCETAFATTDEFSAPATSTCFLDIDEDGDGNGDFNRWGWSISIPTPGVYAFPIYAGAGQCDTSKGTLVGYLVVEYDGLTLMATYEMNPGYEMDEVHFYAGSDILASNGGAFTVAPGQYPNIQDNLRGAPDNNFSTAFTWDIDWEGNWEEGGAVNIVAHAVVCGQFEE